jgi:hypothetical protein
VDWFAKGWWIAFELENDQVKVVDIRFTEIPAAPDDFYHHWNWPFSWVFEKNTMPVQLQRAKPLQQEFTATLQLLASRVTGGAGWLKQGNGPPIRSPEASKQYPGNPLWWQAHRLQGACKAVELMDNTAPLFGCMNLFNYLLLSAER